MWRERAIKVALIVIGLLFVAIIYPVLSILWHRDQSGYTDAMMGTIYFVLGIFMLMAVRNPAANRSLIGFTAWSSLAHSGVMTVMELRGSTERYGIGVAIFAVVGVVLLALILKPEAERPPAAATQGLAKPVN
jgi:Na+/H+ antiporter NhaA